MTTKAALEQYKACNEAETARAYEIKRLIDAIDCLDKMEVDHEGATIRDGKAADYGYISVNINCLPLGPHFTNEMLIEMQTQMNLAIKKIANETAAKLVVKLRDEYTNAMRKTCS